MKTRTVLRKEVESLLIIAQLILFIMVIYLANHGTLNNYPLFVIGCCLLGLNGLILYLYGR